MPAAKWHLTPNLNAKGPLSKAQIKTFFDDGYLFLPEWYKQDALDAVRVDVESMIDNLAIRLHRAGKIKDLYDGLDWTSRLLRMRQDFPDAPVILIKGGVLPVSLQNMFVDPKMLDIANQVRPVTSDQQPLKDPTIKTSASAASALPSRTLLSCANPSLHSAPVCTSARRRA